ncbi:hypothetical protein A3A59_04365, partial [Candidatus Gottesmanbacteria bacterium RIFCSPLOWO2_01_FULL_42_10]
MKIGIDISQSVYVGTGVSVYTQNLVRNLLKIDQVNQYVLFGSTLRRQAYLYDFLNTLPKKSSFTSKIYSLPPTALDIIWNKLHALSIDHFLGTTDVVHTSDWTEPPSKAHKVTTIHDLIVYKYPENLPKRIVETQKQKLAWVKKETDLVIAVSTRTKEDIIQYLQIPQAKIHVVYQGIDESYFPQKIDSILSVKKKYHIKGRYVLCVGTREPRKNLARVVKAFSQLKLDSYTLVIAGNPGWGKEVVIGKNMLMTGYVEAKDLPALYSGTSGFVYPSLYEGFGMPILEAMACGAPV